MLGVAEPGVDPRLIVRLRRVVRRQVGAPVPRTQDDGVVETPVLVPCTVLRAHAAGEGQSDPEVAVEALAVARIVGFQTAAPVQHVIPDIKVRAERNHATETKSTTKQISTQRTPQL